MEEKTRLEKIEDTLNEIAESIPKKKVKKKVEREFKIPFNAKVMGKKQKENFVTVMRINENGNVGFSKERIQDQTIVIDDVPRIASGKYVMKYKRNPLIILPNWSVVPFSPSENYDKTMFEGANSNGYRLLMNRMQAEAIKLGRKIGGWGIGIGAAIVVGVIIFALLTGK